MKTKKCDCKFMEKTEFIKRKNVTVVGYDSQGEANAKNLRDSGVMVTIGLEIDEFILREQAKRDGFCVLNTENSVKNADLVMFFVSEEIQ